MIIFSYQSFNLHLGIGFKACFTVAKQVYIRSNHFSFMLDKANLLLPAWVEPSDFPSIPGMEKMHDGETVMFLRYLPDKDPHKVSEQMMKLNTGTLCFLRKLRYGSELYVC